MPFSSVHGPALASDRPDQLYRSYEPEPPPSVREAILQGALETTDQDYQATALDLGTLLKAPSEQHSEPDFAIDTDEKSSITPSSDDGGSITGGV